MPALLHHVRFIASSFCLKIGDLSTAPIRIAKDRMQAARIARTKKRRHMFEAGSLPLSTLCNEEINHSSNGPAREFFPQGENPRHAAYAENAISPFSTSSAPTNKSQKVQIIIKSQMFTFLKCEHLTEKSEKTKFMKTIFENDEIFEFGAVQSPQIL